VNLFFQTGHFIGRFFTQKLKKQPQRSLIERNQDLISKRLDQIQISNEPYYIENQVRDCISQIATREGRSNLIPAYGEWLEWLSQWSSRPNLPNDFRELKDHLLNVFRIRHDYLTRKKQEEHDLRVKREMHEQQVKEKEWALFKRNKDLILKFLEIAERKVSIVDDYGDENWAALPIEIDMCLRKIGEREGLAFDWREYTKSRRRGEFGPRFGRRRYGPPLPNEYRVLQQQLEEAFREYHLQKRSFEFR